MKVMEGREGMCCADTDVDVWMIGVSKGVDVLLPTWHLDHVNRRDRIVMI